MTDASGTPLTIKLDVPDMFTKQQLWQTVVELSVENTKLKARLKKKKTKERRP